MNREPSITTYLRACAAALAISVAPVGMAQAAQPDSVPGNWWFYIHNDKASDLQALLRQGANPNVLYKNGQPALMRAVVDGAWNVFDVLAADPRTDLNAVNPANETALMYLAVAGDTERARKLINRGAQVNRLGWTPLHYAASKGHIQTAKLLLAHNAMVNAPSPEGTTPIMMAALSGNREMVKLLMDAGADVTTRNLKGQNAADWAYTAKQGKLGDELTKLIAQVERARMAQRGGAPAGNEQASSGAAVAPRQVPAASSTMNPATEATQVEAPKSSSNAVGGVTGVRLGTYD
ncbi:ankyrin repeat domain-containing protein [Bordetella sp. 02P26C-1]|uniref:ankyrin repeat domain-containing protein n=1 Tax=Bordetella sp. 02P26C-1 TaxID=2683195 RepID=UPI0013547C9E|nr:ankyrin repeat domain-containing protein [Bordetella sp. 02P26C-1]